jgi:hypothetical protein
MNKKNSGCLLLLIVLVAGIVITLKFKNAHDQKKTSSSQDEEINFALKVESLTPIQRQTLSSLKKLDDHPLYRMDYFADYRFDEFLLRGVSTAVGNRVKAKHFSLAFACTSFIARNSGGETIFAHNSDAPKYPKVLVFTTSIAGKRYASMAMVNINLLGYGSKNPRLDTMKRRIGFLDAPYYAQEGMNEKGVAIAIKGIKGYRVFHPGKISLTGLHIVRLVLDYAANLDEAIQLIKKYNNIHADELHYMIADAGGRSAVIEYIDSKVLVIPNREKWQVASNRLIGNADPESKILLHCNRYRTAYYKLKKVDGIITLPGAMTILQSVTQKRSNPTHWSAVYNLTTGSIIAVLERKFKTIRSFHLNMN